MAMATISAQNSSRMRSADPPVSASIAERMTTGCAAPSRSLIASDPSPKANPPR